MSKDKEKKISLRKKAEETLSKQLDSSQEFSIEDSKNIIHELQVHQIELQMQNDELQLTHDELEKSKQRYLDLYNKAPVGYFELNNNFMIQKVNATALKLLDLNHDDVIDESITKYIFKDDQDIFYLFGKKLQVLNEQHSTEFRMLKSDGNIFWAHLEANLDKDDISNGVFGLVIHDISDRKKYESELKMKDEMLIIKSRQAAMGEMISMIAHQWRQPLMVVGMVCNNIKLDIALGAQVTSEEMQMSCNDVQVQISYLSKTIDNFRNFLEDDLQKKSISIYDVIESTLNIIRNSLENNNIKIKTDFNCTNTLEIVQSELNQVFINIINNAKDSLLENNIKDPEISIKTYEDEDFINIEISDNGGGIPADILPKLGEPYISSRSINGAGLGIYMSKIIIEKHMNGILKWKNLDKGACFTILLRKL